MKSADDKLAPPEVEATRCSLHDALGRMSEGIESFLRELESAGHELSQDEMEALSNRFARALCPAEGTSGECWFVERRGDQTIIDLAKCPRCRFAADDERPLARLASSLHTIVHRLLDANLKLGRMASRDSLTGVHNRTFFDEALELEVAEAMRAQGRIMFIMIDVDGFKEINDTYGHVYGDQILTLVARLLRENVRASDMVVRYGGDEFLIVAPRVDEEACLPVVSRLARANTELDSERLALSVGCSTWCPGQDVRAAIALADERMYENKRTKRFVDDENTCSSSPRQGD